MSSMYAHDGMRNIKLVMAMVFILGTNLRNKIRTYQMEAIKKVMINV